MYEAFYGLNEKPFNLTPDPRFLYLSSKHKEAFAHLLYGIRNRCGFVMVSGEIGTGKTTICRSLLKQLDPDTEVAFIFNPKLSPIELLKTINSDFGIDSKADTVRGLIDELNIYLLDRAGEGKNCVLIIDEAQNLGTETLEQIRLLSNLETETEKLLQIVLIGQPELAEKLELNELRQLNQRITARYHLGTLSRDETLHYIAFRLRVAGGRKKVRFTRAAVRRVHRISRGTPRVINAVCDRALLIGYTQEARTISPAVVKKAAREVHGDRPSSSRGTRSRLLPASAFAAALLALVAALVLRGDLALSNLGLAGVPTAAAPIDSPRSSAEFESPAEPAIVPAPVASSDSSPAVEVARGIAEAASLPPAGETIAPAGEADQLSESAPIPEQVASVPGGAGAGGMKVVETSPTVHQGLAELVRAWNLAVLQTPPVKVTPDAVARFANANGLRMLSLTPSVEEMVAVGLPVLVKLRDGDWCALMSVQQGEAKLIRRDGSKEGLSLAGLRDRYAREAIYLWSDPNPRAGILRAMSLGPEVTELQSDLQKLGLLDREPNGTYDASTIDAVTRIQRATGLNADGISGPQTRMVLASWLGRPGTPRLSNTGFSDGLRARILAAAGMVIDRGEIQAPAENGTDVESTAAPADLAPADLAPAAEEPSTEGTPEQTAPGREEYVPVLPGGGESAAPAQLSPSTSRVVPIKPSATTESDLR